MSNHPAEVHHTSLVRGRQVRRHSNGGVSQDHFFEDARHHDMVLSGISTGTLPLRFAYAGSAAYTHDLLAYSEGYQSVVGSADLEAQMILREVLPYAPVPAVAEIGPGNGWHTTALFRALSAEGVQCQAYLGLDFSATLLSLACDRIGAELRNTVITPMIWDVEASGSDHVEKWRQACGLRTPLLVCLLGHTLGNVESVDTTLTHLHGSLRTGDVLLVSVALFCPNLDDNAVISPYTSSVFRAAALEPLYAAGVNERDVEFGVRYDQGVVVGEAVFIRGVRIGALQVPYGQVLRCFLSRRFTMHEVLSLLADTGWNVRSATTDEPQQHAVVVAVRGE